jgi:hypothetical protein
LTTGYNIHQLGKGIFPQGDFKKLSCRNANYRKKDKNKINWIDDMYTETARIVLEAVSAIACAVLVRFMIKPYRLTRESRYLGLPLGFGILGLSWVLTVVLLSPPFYLNAVLSWIAHLTRVFGFVFLAVTYFFSKEPSKNSRVIWNLTISVLIVSLIALSLLLVFTPKEYLSRYLLAIVAVRILTLIFLSYIIIHTVRNHLSNHDPKTRWIPLGFILLAISQFSLLMASADYNNAILWGWGGLALRLAGLAVFLIVAYRTFYSSKEKGV